MLRALVGQEVDLALKAYRGAKEGHHEPQCLINLLLPKVHLPDELARKADKIS